MQAKALRRMFKDFPFLWAIEQKWRSDSTSIIADYPDELLFQSTYHFDPKGKREIWIVFTQFGKDNDLEIRRVNAPAGTKLGRAIFYHSEISTGSAVEYVIVADKSFDVITIIIYKPPKNAKYNYNGFILDSVKKITE